MIKFIFNLFRKVDYSQYPDAKPLGISKTITSPREQDYNEYMYDLYSREKSYAITKQEFTKNSKTN